MEPSLFNVIYTGKFKSESGPDLVSQAFADKFKIPHLKAKKIVLIGKEVTIKPKVEHVKAYQFKTALEKLGMEVRLQRVVTPLETKPSETLSVETKSQEFKEESQPAPVSKQNTAEVVAEAKNEQPQYGRLSSQWELEPIEQEVESEDEVGEGEQGSEVKHEPGYMNLTQPTVIKRPEPVASESAEEVESHETNDETDTNESESTKPIVTAAAFAEKISSHVRQGWMSLMRQIKK